MKKGGWVHDTRVWTAMAARVDVLLGGFGGGWVSYFPGTASQARDPLEVRQVEQSWAVLVALCGIICRRNSSLSVLTRKTSLVPRTYVRWRWGGWVLPLRLFVCRVKHGFACLVYLTGSGVRSGVQ